MEFHKLFYIFHNRTPLVIDTLVVVVVCVHSSLSLPCFDDISVVQIVAQPVVVEESYQL